MLCPFRPSDDVRWFSPGIPAVVARKAVLSFNRLSIQPVIAAQAAADHVAIDKSPKYL